MVHGLPRFLGYNPDVRIELPAIPPVAAIESAIVEKRKELAELRDLLSIARGRELREVAYGSRQANDARSSERRSFRKVDVDDHTLSSTRTESK
jgi:hypothetical protein